MACKTGISSGRMVESQGGSGAAKGGVSGAEFPGQEVGSGEVAGVEIGGVEHSVLIPTTTHDTRKMFQEKAERL